MSRRPRLILFAVAAAGLGVALIHGLVGLPRFGDYHGVYGATLNHAAVAQRKATDVVTAITFDYRGLDTMGEEFILFAASIGLVVLLREQRDEHEASDDDNAPQDRDAPRRSRAAPEHPTSPALIVLGRWLAAPVLVLGIYVVTHGQLTPGGGFQGGVILATAVILVSVAVGRVRMAPIRPAAIAEGFEALGAGGYVALGLGGLISGGRFLTNFLPLGKSGTLLSGGAIPSLSAVVGLEVAGAITLVVSEFIDQRLFEEDR